MYILAIEQSTAISSLAMMHDYSIVAERNWEESHVRNQHFFTLLPDLLKEASIDPAGIDTFALGLGPGSFSGLRCALAAFQGLALPEKKPVFGISSAEALAWQTMNETGAESVMVLGDARRGHIWYVCYDKNNDFAVKRDWISLVSTELLPSKLAMCNMIVTSDWDRIGRFLQTVPAGTRVLENKQTPTARTVGELAFRKISKNIPSEKLTPIYLHPPVAVRT